MLRESTKLSPRHRMLFHGTFTLLFVTGALWLVFHHFVGVASEFGDGPHPLEQWWLKIHGAAAMGFLVVFGSLVRGHIRLGWKMRKNRISGAALVSAVLAPAMTGWGLYYIGSEVVRSWVSAVHWGVGLLSPMVIFVHVFYGRRSERTARVPARVLKKHRLRPMPAFLSAPSDATSSSQIAADPRGRSASPRL